MFLPNWSLKGEAIYYNLGNMNVGTAAMASPAYGASIGRTIPSGDAGAISSNNQVNFQGVVARAGLNYHFNFGGSAPIVAKY